MSDFLRFWNLRSQGAILRPSLLFGCFYLEAKDLSENISTITQVLPLIRGAANELRQVSSFYQIPRTMATSPYLYLLNRRVRDLCLAALGIFGFLSLASPVWRPFVSSMIPGLVQKPIDIDAVERFIQRTQTSIHRLQSKLQKEGDLPTVKKEVSALCRDLIHHLREVNQASASTDLGNIAFKLGELKGVLDGMILEPIANKEDPPTPVEETTGSSLFVRLGALGLRNSHFGSIARRIGWNENEYHYLPLRFAEQGIFSIKSLTQIPTTTEGQENYLVELLQYPAVSLPPHQQRWESIKRLALQIDRVVASIFAVSFQLFSFTAIYYTPFILKLFYLADGIYMASRSHNIQISRSDFVKAGMQDRLRWIIRAGDPVYGLSYVATKAIRDHGVRALPRTFYATYLV